MFEIFVELKNFAMESCQKKIFSMNRAILFSRETCDAFTLAFWPMLLPQAHRLELTKEFSRIFFPTVPLCFCFSKHSLKLNLLRLQQLISHYFIVNTYLYNYIITMWHLICFEKEFCNNLARKDRKTSVSFLFSRRTEQNGENIIFPHH